MTTDRATSRLRGARPGAGSLHAVGAPGTPRSPVTAEQASVWADGLADTVRAEIGDARRRGLITAGEAEQLLARIVLVIDQALVPRGIH